MAMLALRTKELTFTGTVDASLLAVPAGTLIACLGCRVNVAATGGTIPTVIVQGATLMVEAQILPQAAGLKRSASPSWVMTTAAGSIDVDTTGLTGTPSITFFFVMAKIDPGAGEV